VFIIIDGVDGVGKTTIIKALQAHPQEFFDGAVEYNIGLSNPVLKKQIMEAQKDGDIDLKNRLILDSLEEVQTQFIATRLKNNIHVVMDRYISTYFAYQKVPSPSLDSINRKQYLRINKTMVDHLATYPSYYFYLEAPFTVVNDRLKKRNKDILDHYYINNRDMIHNGYDWYFDDLPINHKYRIDTTQSLEACLQVIKNALCK
jgi:thymidylate kinase